MADMKTLTAGTFEQVRDAVALSMEKDPDSGLLDLVLAFRCDRQVNRRPSSSILQKRREGKLFHSACGGWPEMRARAAAELYLQGEAAFRKELQAALASKENLVRYYAARAVATLVDPGDEAEAVELLIELTADPVLMVRREAVRGLGRCGGSPLTAVLLPFLADPSENMRRNAAEALAISGDLRALVPLIESLEDGDWHVRKAAALAIAALAKRQPGIEVRRAIPALRKGVGGWSERRPGLREAYHAAIDAIEAGSADVADVPIAGGGHPPQGPLPISRA